MAMGNPIFPNPTNPILFVENLKAYLRAKFFIRYDYDLVIDKMYLIWLVLSFTKRNKNI